MLYKSRPTAKGMDGQIHWYLTLTLKTLRKLQKIKIHSEILILKFFQNKMVQTRLATAYRSRASIRCRQSKYFPQIYAVFQRTAPLLPDLQNSPPCILCPSWEGSLGILWRRWCSETRLMPLPDRQKVWRNVHSFRQYRHWTDGRTDRRNCQKNIALCMHCMHSAIINRSNEEHEPDSTLSPRVKLVTGELRQKFIMPRPHRAEALRDDARLTSVWRLSVAYIWPKSRTVDR